MAYMIYQQLTTAIKEAYAGHSALDGQAQAAKNFREWLEALEIKPQLRDPLVEQARALEEAFQDLLVEADRARRLE